MVSLAIVFAVLRYMKPGGENVDVLHVLSRLDEAIPEKIAGVYETRTNSDMPAIEIDGVDFIGILEFPEMDIRFPVGAEWKGSGGSYCPARYSGSVYDRSLVIGGAYKADNFDFLDSLDVGGKIVFTDMTGCVYTFEIAKIRHSEKALKEAFESDDGLTLFVKKSSVYIVLSAEPVA